MCVVGGRERQGEERERMSGTPIMLRLAGVSLLLMQYGRIGDACRCWMPAQFTGAWNRYTVNYCYSQGTYYVCAEQAWETGREESERMRGMSIMLLLAGVSLLLMQYGRVGDACRCWTLVQFTGVWNQYTANYCYSQGTYSVCAEQAWETGREESERMRGMSIMLLLAGVSLLLMQYGRVSDACRCWTLAQFTGVWNQYTANYCYSQCTYYVCAEQAWETGREESERMRGMSIMLLLAGVSLLLMQYGRVGDACRCWTLAQFTGVWNQYTANYCYSQCTYYVCAEQAWETGREESERMRGMSIMLLLAGVSLLLMQYGRVGDACRCWTLAQFTGVWNQYTANYCYSQGTYYMCAEQAWETGREESERMRGMSIMLLLAGVSLLLMQYGRVGDACRCWTLAQFTGVWNQYTANYCYSQGTYYVCAEQAWETGREESERMRGMSIMLLLAGVSLLLMQYGRVGDACRCWTLAQFTGVWNQYTANYCYSLGTYYVPIAELVPDSVEVREAGRRLYYQWVPLVLIVQALGFWAPNWLWKRLKAASGVSVKGVLYAASLAKKDVRADTRSALVYVAARHLRESLHTQRKHEKISGRLISRFFYGDWRGTYVTTVYLCIKALYILNVLLQFYWMNHFLAPAYTFWGWGILKDLFNGVSWKESGQFPRVTLCDFQVRVLGNLHRWTVQCVLMINMFNEKVFIFFWWWFAIVGVLSLGSAVYWAYVCLLASRRRSFVEQYLRVTHCVSVEPDENEQKLVSKFVNKSLRPDGVFLLRLIQTNGGDLLTAEMIKALWDLWRPENDADLPGEILKDEFPELDDTPNQYQA